MLKQLFGYAALMSAVTYGIKLLTFGVGVLGLKLKSKDDFGNYATYVIVYGILQNFLIGGVNQVIQRYAADDDEARKKFGRLALAQFPVALGLGVAGFFIIGTIWGNWSIALAPLGVPWIVVWFWTRYLYRTRLDARGEAALVVVASLGNSLCTLGLLAFTDLRDSLIYGDFAGLVIAGLLALFMIPRASGASLAELAKTKIERDFYQKLLIFGRALWGANQLFAASGWLQGLVTRGKLGAEKMGDYGGVGQFAQLIYQPMDFVAHAALPGLVQAKEQRDVMYRELLRLCLLAFPFVALAVSAGLPLLLTTVDGAIGLLQPSSASLASKYGNVHLLLLIGSIGTPMLAIEVVAGQYVVAEGRTDMALKAAGIRLVAMLLTLVVALWTPLYPLLGDDGALYVIIGAQGVGWAAQALLYVGMLWHSAAADDANRKYKTNMKTSLVYGLQTQLCAFAGAAPVVYFRHWEHNWLLVIPATAIFVVGMIAFRLLHREDFRRLWRAIAQRGAKPVVHDVGFETAPIGFERTMSKIQTDKVREVLALKRDAAQKDDDEV